MLSRVANSVFWMARYMERSTCLLRVVRTHYIASQDDMQDLDWQLLLKTYSATEAEKRESITSPTTILQNLVLDRENRSSVINNIAKARENARAVQDNITKEVWQCLNDSYHLIREPQLQQNFKYGDPITTLDILLRECMLYYGTVDTTMARGEGFNFLNIGKFLERAMQSAHVLQMKLLTDSELNETTSWRYVLYSLSGYQMYLKTYRGSIEPTLVTEHALHNDDFPHSVLYCIQQMHRYFQRLQPDSVEESYRQMDFRIGKAVNLLRYSDIEALNKMELSTLLFQIQTELFNIANGFNEYYFGLNY
jgi:uncharacterized alpha-E superfamily protein